MKSFSKIIFIAYLLFLMWLVLFKFSYDIVSVITTFHMSKLDLIPFVGNNPREMFENVLVFVPFGLLLSVNLKQLTLWRKLVLIFTFSIAVEVIQFILAIGRTDITDVITNTIGGLIGLWSYEFGKKYIDSEKLDRAIIILIALILVVLVLLRSFVFKVKY